VTEESKTGLGDEAKADEPVKAGAVSGRWPSEQDEEEDTAGPAGTPPNRPGPTKADTLNRAVARFIDILFALLLAELPGRVGLFAGLTYVGVADGLMGGQSIGKRIIGLRVVKGQGGGPADIRASILRNSTMGAIYLVYHIPLVGWIIASAGLAFEFLLVIGSREGKRLGDEMAGTVVVDEHGKP